jgi:hypothetical protein
VIRLRHRRSRRRAEQALEAGFDRAVGGGFRQERIDVEMQGGPDTIQFGMAGQQHHLGVARDVAAPGANRLQQADAVELGHVEVGNDAIGAGTFVLQHRQGAFAVAGFEDGRRAEATDDLRKSEPGEPNVVDNQYFAGA